MSRVAATRVSVEATRVGVAATRVGVAATQKCYSTDNTSCINLLSYYK